MNLERVGLPTGRPPQPHYGCYDWRGGCLNDTGHGPSASCQRLRAHPV